MLDCPELSRIPSKYVAAIGRVIVRWSYLEWFTKERILYTAAGLGEKEGRFCVKECRPKEAIALVRHLTAIHQLRVPLPIHDLEKRLEKAKDERDQLAHGLWLWHPVKKSLRLWQTKGSWNPTKPGAPTGPKKMTPEIVVKTPADIVRTYRDIDDLIRHLHQFEKSLRGALATLPQTHPVRISMENRRPPRKPNMR